jgi:hypothetical protein
VFSVMSVMSVVKIWVFFAASGCWPRILCG